MNLDDMQSSSMYKHFVPKLSKQETLEKIKDLNLWYHSMYFGHGIMVKGMRNTFRFLRELGLPENLNGKTVLDIGAANGFFSFECEARGAKRVLALDRPGGQWNYNTEYFQTAKEILGSSVNLREVDIYDADVKVLGTYDVVLFLGVLYHLMDPFMALRKLRALTGEFLLLETHIIEIPLPKLDVFGDQQIPVALFYDEDQLSNDPSNWWSPNLSCLKRLLKASGFGHIEVVKVDMYKNSWQGRAILKAW
ncbi:class I SAM-dependent methyltransferase [Paenibacillus tarimensis]